MTRNSLVASFGLVASLAAALSAQATSTNGKVDQKAIHSIRVKVIGCVASAGSRESQRGLRPFCGEHDAAARHALDGNRGGVVSVAGRILRGPNASAAQHPLVCPVGSQFLQSYRPARAVSTQSPAARRNCETLRAVASAPRAAESRPAGPALSTAPAPPRPRQLSQE